MQYFTRWIPAIAVLGLAAACSDSQPATSPLVPSGIWAHGGALSCEVELDELRSAIGAAEFTGQRAATDEANMLAKVDDAERKLAQGKAADALQKLENIRETALALSTPDAKGKTKLDAEGAAAIIAAVNVAETCIQALIGTTAP